MNSDQQKVIQNRVEALLATPAQEASNSAFELIILLRVLAEHQPPLAKRLYQHFWSHGELAAPPSPIRSHQLCQGTAMAEFSRYQSYQQPSTEEVARALQIRGQLQLQLDPQTSGIVSPPGAEAPNETPLAIQTLWIQNAEHLGQFAVAAELDTEEISLELEVLVHETNRQYWSDRLGTYRLAPDSTSEAASPQPLQFLPLWAKIPDQDQAEDMLVQLRASAPPWVDPEDDSWVSAVTLLIYEGLQYYEMHKAAQELKSYLYRHCYNRQDNWLHTCISLAFAASTPA